MKAGSRFYSSLVLLIGLNFIIKPIWIFAIDRQVQNETGTLAYGNYFSLLNLSIVLGFLLDAGLSNLLNRELASRRILGSSTVGNIFYLKLLLTLLYAGTMCMIAWLTGIRSWELVAGFIFLQIFNSFFLFFRAIITAHQWFTADAWLSVVDKAMVILSITFFFLIPFNAISIPVFLLVQVYCAGLALLISILVLRSRSISLAFMSKPVFDFGIFRSLMPFALIILLMSVHSRLDGFLLERIHVEGDYEAGIYASAYRLLDAANMVGFLMASFLLPFLARAWNESKPRDEVINNARHFLVIFSIGIACIGFFMSNWIQETLYPPDLRAADIIKYCLPSLIGYALVQVYGTVLTAAGQIRSFCLVIFIAVLVSLAINLVFIPRFGALASCWAALISQPIAGLLCMYYARRKLGVELNSHTFLIYIFIAVILSTLFYTGTKFGIHEVVLILAAVVLTFIIMGTTRLFTPALWMNIFKRSQLPKPN